MKNKIEMHDTVALLEDVPVNHFENGRPLILRRGQIGTVVMTYPENAFEVEFSDTDGRTFALLALQDEQLMILRNAPDYAVA